MVRRTSSGTSIKEPGSGKVTISPVIGLAIRAFFRYDLGVLATAPLARPSRQAPDLCGCGGLCHDRHIHGRLFDGRRLVVSGSRHSQARRRLSIQRRPENSVWICRGSDRPDPNVLTARYVAQDTMEHTVGKSRRPLRDGVTKHVFGYQPTQRLAPLCPFLVSRLIRVGAGTYTGTTAHGIVPGSFVYASAGRRLISMPSLKDIASAMACKMFAATSTTAIVHCSPTNNEGAPL